MFVFDFIFCLFIFELVLFEGKESIPFFYLKDMEFIRFCLLKSLLFANNSIKLAEKYLKKSEHHLHVFFLY